MNRGLRLRLGVQVLSILFYKGIEEPASSQTLSSNLRFTPVNTMPGAGYSRRHFWRRLRITLPSWGGVSDLAHSLISLRDLNICKGLRPQRNSRSDLWRLRIASHALAYRSSKTECQHYH